MIYTNTPANKKIQARITTLLKRFNHIKVKNPQGTDGLLGYSQGRALMLYSYVDKTNTRYHNFKLFNCKHIDQFNIELGDEKKEYITLQGAITWLTRPIPEYTDK